jgi:hypothetical protein
MNVTDEDISLVLKQHPELTGHGIGIYAGNKLTKEDYDKAFSDEVDYLYNHKSEIQDCLEWLLTAEKRKSMNVCRSSYGIKHIVEKHCKRYVSNGALIVAAIMAGFNIKQCRAGGANVYLNISEKSKCL